MTAAPPALAPIAIGPAAQKLTPPGPDATLGYAVVAWCEQWLDHPETDEPWEFTAEQLRFVLWMYAIRPGGAFRWTDAVLRRSKGWGKDPLAAALAICEFVGPCRFGGFDDDAGVAIVVPHPNSLVQIGAVNEPQTENTTEMIKAMLPERTIDRYRIDPGVKRWHAGQQTMKVVPTSPAAIEGGRVTFFVAGETHHWGRGNHGISQAATIRRNLGKAPDGAAHFLAITNAHDPNLDTTGRRDYQRYLRNRDNPSSSLLYDSLEAPDDLDLTDREQRRAGVIAARGDSYWLPVDRITDNEYENTEPADYQRFYLNKIVAGAGKWMDESVWQGSAARPVAHHLARTAFGDLTEELWRGHRWWPAYEAPAGRKIALGFDGSRTNDATGLVATDLETFYQWIVAVWERNYANTEWEVPAHEVNEVVAWAFERWDVCRMYVDPEHWDETVASWAGMYRRREKKVIAEQRSAGRELEIARRLRAYRGALRMRTVTHQPTDDDSPFQRHVMNAVRRLMQATDEEGQPLYVLDKPSDAEKIDLAMCGMYSYWAATDAIASGVMAEEPEVKFSFGFLT